MRTIYKYALSWETPQTVLMPSGAKVLHVAFQRGGLFVWAEVEVPHSRSHEQGHVFHIVGTGHEMLAVNLLRYLGTVHENGFVWHIYEQMP